MIDAERGHRRRVTSRMTAIRRVSAFGLRMSLLHVVNGMVEKVAVNADVTLDHGKAWSRRRRQRHKSLDDRWALTAFDYGKPWRPLRVDRTSWRHAAAGSG
jgi:hypothetical protein